MSDPRRVATPVPSRSPCGTEGRAGRVSGKAESWAEKQAKRRGCPPETTAFPQPCAESRNRAALLHVLPGGAALLRWSLGRGQLLASWRPAGPGKRSPARARNCLRMLQSGALLSLPRAAWSSSPVPCRRLQQPTLCLGSASPLDRGGRWVRWARIAPPCPVASWPEDRTHQAHRPGPWKNPAECSGLRAGQLQLSALQAGNRGRGGRIAERGPLPPPPPVEVPSAPRPAPGSCAPEGREGGETGPRRPSSFTQSCRHVCPSSVEAGQCCPHAVHARGPGICDV